MEPPKPPPLSYRDAGVDIDSGNLLVERIKPLARRTARPGVLGGLGGFGALFGVKELGYRDPVLVATTDGVGTKLKLAMALGRHGSIGIDLVAMCVNDLVVQGAEPLMFLDYYATGRLDVDTAATVIEGIARGCELAGCALVGGETAEMPGMYSGGDYDLAGFSVGVVERDGIIDGSRVRAGDAILGIASSGPHSNGYSLIRRILERSGADLAAPCGDSSLGEALMTPTRIYVRPLLDLIRGLPVHALAHITGGGLVENLPRVLPAGSAASIRRGSWSLPPVFDWIRETGNVAEPEMLRTFNCGIGMAVVVPEERAATAVARLEAAGERVWVIGSIESREPDAAAVRFV